MQTISIRLAKTPTPKIVFCSILLCLLLPVLWFIFKLLVWAKASVVVRNTPTDVIRETL